MSIKIGGTVVIDNNRNFTNIVGANGLYTDLHPTLATQSSSGSITLDANNPSNLLTLTGNLTVTDMTNKFPGKQCIFLTDVTASGYDITWGSNFKFVNDTEPDWTTARYWMIGTTIWDNNTILVTATSWAGSGGSAATVDLGSTINTYSSGSGLGGYARTTLAIGQSGTIATSGTGTSGSTSNAVSRTWLLSGSASDYQIKWDGTGDTSYLISNSGLGTWLNGGANHSWVIEEDDNDSVTRSVSGTLSIRDTATSTVQDTVSVTISADFSP